MSEFVFQEILDALGARRVQGNPRACTQGLSTDSRTIQPGQLFVALSGPNFDGNQFVLDAVKRGAAGVILREDPQLGDLDTGDVPIAAVPDTRVALGDLAAWHRSRMTIPVIGITGSCGKTTTKNMLLELLSTSMNVHVSPASFNNDIGVPLTILSTPAAADVVVVEIGTNAPGEIASLCSIARPTCGVITNVGAAHLEGLGSVEGVAREKGCLAAAIPPDGFVVLNADCRWTELIETMATSRNLQFGIDRPSERVGDLDARNVHFHAGCTTFELAGRALGGESREVTLPLLGLHTVQNLLAALTTCLGLGLDLDRVLAAVSRLRDGRRRMERIEAGGITVLDDTYNANPESARASVRVLAGLHGFDRRVLVLGDMYELGEYAAEKHREVGAFAAHAGLDLVILVGEHVRDSASGARKAGLSPDQVIHFADPDAAVDGVPALLSDRDVVLVKGSRAVGMERIVMRIVELNLSMQEAELEPA